MVVTCENAEAAELGSEHFEECWGETSVKIDEGETVEQGAEMLLGMGWKPISANKEGEEKKTYHFCPYCNKGVTVEEFEKKMRDEDCHLERVK
jgi:hypothetical protein